MSGKDSLLPRRAFLNQALNTIGFGFWLNQFPSFAFGLSSPSKYIVTADTFADPHQDLVLKHAIDTPGFLATLDLSNESIKRFPLPITPHSFNQHPLQTRIALGVAKWTPSAIVVDIVSGHVLKQIKAPEGYIFFGHAVFDNKGQRAFLTADSEEYLKGGLCVYDAKTWKLQKIVDLGGRIPHECLWTKQNQIAIVIQNFSDDHQIHERLRSEIIFLDPENFKILQRFPVPNASHIIQIDSQNFLSCGGSGLNEECEFFILNTGTGKKIDFRESPDFPKTPIVAEGLSMAVLSPTQMSVTVSQKKQLLTWDTHTNRLRFDEFDQPTLGLIVSGSDLFLSFKNSHLRKKKLATDHTLLANVGTEISSRFGNSSHLRLLTLK